MCYETILKQGFKACVACENHVVTQALEDVTEANIYLSTIGFESSGLGAAHSTQIGLCTIPEVEKYYHGEVVAFCCLVALVLENADIEQINIVLQFLYSIGLPMTLEEIGIKNLSQKQLHEVAVVSSVNNIHMYKMPFKVTPEMVEAAIIVADKLGHYFKKHGNVPGGLNDLGKDCLCSFKK
ncbi:MAG: iron-containing alcohol dehydrogenase [Clostridia bacterium]|nr:iron-containing alcohol dehydrogenase [Clostridia bacterium]